MQNLTTFCGALNNLVTFFMNDVAACKLLLLILPSIQTQVKETCKKRLHLRTLKNWRKRRGHSTLMFWLAKIKKCSLIGFICKKISSKVLSGNK